MSSNDPQPLELQIYSLPFRLRAPAEEHERLRRAARHVDSVMRELVGSAPTAETTKLAIQAAFLIATDYFRTLDEGFAGGGPPARMASRVDNLLFRLEGALTEIKTALRPLAEEETRLESGEAETEQPATELLADELPVVSAESAPDAQPHLGPADPAARLKDGVQSHFSQSEVLNRPNHAT